MPTWLIQHVGFERSCSKCNGLGQVIKPQREDGRPVCPSFSLCLCLCMSCLCQSSLFCIPLTQTHDDPDQASSYWQRGGLFRLGGVGLGLVSIWGARCGEADNIA